MSRIVCLHGVPKKIVSDRGSQLTSKFSERLHETLDTQLRFSSAYHPQTNGQIESVNQILEDMLRACALQYGRSWDKSLSYPEFSYNNSYQESLKMAPFEMLYGQRCQTPLFWSETGEWKVFGPDILQEAEKQVRMVRENLWVAQSMVQEPASSPKMRSTWQLFKAQAPSWLPSPRLGHHWATRTCHSTRSTQAFLQPKRSTTKA
jgi:transposase InsO family protein